MSTTKVNVVVHLEYAGENAVWWAESPDAPGFYAAGASLQEVQIVARLALGEIFENLPADGIDLTFAKDESPVWKGFTGGDSFETPTTEPSRGPEVSATQVHREFAAA